MANNTENSFSELIENFTTLQNNAFLVLQKISESVTSEADELEFTLINAGTGESDTYKLPSYKSIKKDIERIDETLKTMLGLSTNGSGVVRNADGSYSVLYKSKLTEEPTKIESVEVPMYFKSKSNWFFENMLNPLLYISVDASKYIPQDESKVCVRRLILSKDLSQLKKDAFDASYKGHNDISYTGFLQWCNTNSIQYTLDEDIQDLPLSQLKYYGSFIVRKIDDYSITNTSGVIGTERRYYLDKITYSDSSLSINNNLELKVGQEVSINQSVYKITMVDSSIRAITLDRVSGYDGIIEGSELKLYSDPENPKMINVNISIDEREVIFFKSINDESNVISREWSDGIGIYSNELKLEKDDGSYTQTTLDYYYNDKVYDYGQQLIGASKDDKISAFYALKPNAPEPIASNFSVLQINTHLSQSDAISKANNYKSAMTTAESNISSLSAKISDLRNEIYNSEYTSDATKNTLIEDLNNAIENKKKEIEDYLSNSSSLQSLLSDNPDLIEDPKYRVRGFFAIPAAQEAENTGKQEIIQFEVRYCYASKDNETVDPEEIDYTEANGLTSTGLFSQWTYYTTRARERSYNTETGIFEWDDVDITDPNAVNPNQIDIPITKNEIVKFQIRSISEAGYPDNLCYSDWSQEISVAFPDDLNTTSLSSDIYESTMIEQTRMKFKQDLINDGYEEHVNDMFKTNEKIWMHDAASISSGFYSDGILLSLYQKLQEQDQLIQELKNKLEAAKAKIVVELKYGDNIVTVNDGDIVEMPTLEYSVSDSSEYGKILKKTYNLIIRNSVAGSILELMSSFPGSITDDFDTVYGSNIKTTNQWTVNGYSNAPIVVNGKYSTSIDSKSNPVTILNEDANSGWFNGKQVLGQFLYVRNRALDRNTEMFDTTAKNITYITGTTGSANAQIWDGFDPNGNAKGGGYYSDFAVHINHPAFNSKSIWRKLYDATGKDLVKCFIDPNSVISDSGLAAYSGKKIPPAFIHSDHLNPDYTKQAAYTSDADYYTSIKYAFMPNDKYLIGKNTCGSYFYLKTDYNYSSIRVGDYDSSTKEIDTSDSGISIPLVFEYRLSDALGLYDGTSITNLDESVVTERRLGIDITTASTVFSFDVIVSAQISISKEEETSTETTVQTTSTKSSTRTTSNS